MRRSGELINSENKSILKGNNSLNERESIREGESIQNIEDKDTPVRSNLKSVMKSG